MAGKVQVNRKPLNPNGERLYCTCGGVGCDTCRPGLFTCDSIPVMCSACPFWEPYPEDPETCPKYAADVESARRDYLGSQAVDPDLRAPQCLPLQPSRER